MSYFNSNSMQRPLNSRQYEIVGSMFTASLDGLFMLFNLHKRFKAANLGRITFSCGDR